MTKSDPAGDHTKSVQKEATHSFAGIQYANLIQDELEILIQHLQEMISSTNKEQSYLQFALQQLARLNEKFAKDKKQQVMMAISTAIDDRISFLTTEIEENRKQTSKSRRNILAARIGVEPEDYYFLDQHNFSDKNIADSTTIMIARDYSHIMFDRENGTQELLITLKDGRLNHRLFYFATGKMSTYKTEQQKQELLEKADGNIILYDSTQLRQKTPITQVINAHYINKLRQLKEKFRENNPDRIYNDLTRVSRRNLQISLYNALLDEILAINDKIEVEKKTKTMGEFILRERNRLIKELLTSSEIDDCMLAQCLMYNSIIAYRSRIAKKIKFNRYKQPYEANSIMNDIDQRKQGSEEFKLDTVIRKPDELKTRDLTGGIQSFISNLGSESYIGNEYKRGTRKKKNDTINVEQILGNELIDIIEDTYQKGSLSQNISAMIEEFSSTYENLGKPDSSESPWKRELDGKLLRGNLIRGIASSGAEDLDEFLKRSLDTLTQAPDGNADVKMGYLPMHLARLVLEYRQKE